MINYRITKYNPLNRNTEGHYLDSMEWTAISDIGKPEYRNVSYYEYEKVESNYVEAIGLILKEKNISHLEINSLSLYHTKEDFENFTKNERLKNLAIDYDKDIAKLKESLKLTTTEIPKYIRLILRETIWMLLLNSRIEIKFGYDYYMYVTCEELKTETIQAIEKTGLFVEGNASQKRILFNQVK